DNEIVEYTEKGIEHVLNSKVDNPLFVFASSLILFGLLIIYLYFEYNLIENESEHN
ncbi:unnamed protein product, partial [marine sediment metagenome]